MNTLVLDCAFAPQVAIIKDKKQIVYKKSDDERHSDTFMALIDSALSEAQITIDDIDTISINVGPGSFTGLRVCISIAKGLGFSLDYKYQIFTSFDYISSKTGANILVPGFSSFVYIKDDKGKMDCVDMRSLDITKKYITFCDGIYNKLLNLGFDVEMCERRNYIQILSANKNYKKMNELEPLYLRKSQAEIEREKKKNNG